MDANAWVDAVREFWFEELESQQWYTASDELDARIEERFGALLERLAAEPFEVARDARAALAAVVVLDQFSRNVFRGTGRAFTQDAAALSIARDAISLGLDRQLSERERQFLYMPFMHSESLEVHAVSIELFKGILDGANLKWAVDHKEIIERFGRYPHRNDALGRESTPEELAYLEDAETFGQ
jgi:uncharacterized protein (DUF924 family)